MPPKFCFSRAPPAPCASGHGVKSMIDKRALRGRCSDMDSGWARGRVTVLMEVHCHRLSEPQVTRVRVSHWTAIAAPHARSGPAPRRLVAQRERRRSVRPAAAPGPQCFTSCCGTSQASLRPDLTAIGLTLKHCVPKVIATVSAQYRIQIRVTKTLRAAASGLTLVRPSQADRKDTKPSVRWPRTTGFFLRVLASTGPRARFPPRCREPARSNSKQARNLQSHPRRHTSSRTAVVLSAVLCEGLW